MTRRLTCTLVAAALAALALAAAQAQAALTPTFTEYATTTNAAPDDITRGPDGNMWFTEFGSAARAIARVTPSGHVDEFPTMEPGSQPQDIVATPDGGLAFADHGATKLGFATTSGSSVEIGTGLTGRPHDIAVGPDNRIWFTEDANDKIGVYNPATHSSTEFPAKGGAGSTPFGLVRGPDSRLWYTERSKGDVVAANVSDPVTKSQSYTTGITPGAEPRGIVVGPDRFIWFTEQSASKIAKLNPATGDVTEYSTPTANATPQGIDVGPDGALWFAENTGGVGQQGAVGRVTTSGAIEEYPVPSAGHSGVFDVARGPDGNMWITEILDSEVARVTTPPSVTSGPVKLTTETTATLAGKIDGHSQATTYHFEYGTTTAYGSSTAEAAVPAGGEPTVTLTGLKPATTYHFRLVATNGTGRVNGADLAFVTEPDTFSGVVVRDQTLKVKKNRVRLLIACPKDALPPSCKGSVTLRSIVAVLIAENGVKRIKAGSAKFTIAPGTSKRVKIKVRKKARRYLKHHRKLKTRATAKATDGFGVKKTRTATVTLKRKKKKH